MICARRQSGFTLVELIAAATLTVLIAGSTVAFLRSTAAARQRVNRQMTLQQKARIAMNAIAASLRNAHRSGPKQAVLEGTDGWLDEAPADRVRLLIVSQRTVRRSQPESDVKECEFFLVGPTQTSPPALMQRIDPTRNEPPDGGGVVQIVVTDVVGLDIIYHDGVRWLDDWPRDQSGWPIAIRIRLIVSDDAHPRKRWMTSRIVNFPHRPSQERQSEE